MDFAKYEGLGNDFVVVDVDSPEALTPARAKEWCDRHFGVGADGVLLVSPGQTPGARATMTVINADGSRPEMCGNGLRCVALHLAIAESQHETRYRVDTDAGVRECHVHRHGDKAQVTIGMGEASVLGSLPFTHAGVSYDFQRISTGNPHAVWFGELPTLAVIDALGPALSANVDGGCNVEFVQQRGSGQLDVVVWERGVGRTLACGTGAVAVAAAAVTAGRAAHGEPLVLYLPGGRLSVTIREPGLTATLQGPARRVFRGQL